MIKKGEAIGQLANKLIEELRKQNPTEMKRKDCEILNLKKKTFYFEIN